MADLLKQLSSLDVVLLIPPLRLGGRACLDVVRAVVHSAVRANAWGVVLVSSVFVESPTSQHSAILEQLEEIETKALVAAAFTFPLHRGKTKELYTSSVTLKEVQRTLQRHANKARPVRLSRVDALKEQPGREFWRVAYWPRAHTQQFLECAVEFTKDVQTAVETSAAVGGEIDTSAMVLPVSQSFEDLTDIPPITLDKWAENNSKRYTQVLAAH
ncbi:hypothetical protein PInf_018552 [Phytophthora infestans]|nr:hypothetical protein PInf_018552 [Phytophthora infestans]